MSKVVLVAKSSDFENADYLDIRPLLVSSGITDYELVELFDTTRLIAAIPSASLVIIVSGALGDREFRAALNGPLLHVWQEALTGECSVLILSQLLLTGSGEEVPGMPAHLRVVPKLRPDTEPKAAGHIGAPPGAQKHQVSILPKFVDYPRLNQRAIESSLQGLYWHWWEPVHPELWQTIVTDVDSDQQRGLIVEHVKLDGRSRIVLSSIALDRIRDEELLTNLIQLCYGGDYNVAFVDTDSGSIETGMIISSLRRTGARVFLYDAQNSADLGLACSAISSGVHDSLLYSTTVPPDVISELEPYCSEGIAQGRLRVLRVSHVDPESSSAELLVRERGSTNDFQDRLAQTRWLLAQGLIGQSIFDTGKVLAAFREVQPSVFDMQDWSALTADLLSRVRPDGSFEGPAVPTAAFIYVASIILLTSSNTQLRRASQRSLKWLIAALEGESASNICRSSVYLERARKLGSEIPKDVLTRVVRTSNMLSPRDRLNLLQIDLELSNLGSAANHAVALMPQLKTNDLSGPGDMSEALMALLSLHRLLILPHSESIPEETEVLRKVNDCITELAEGLSMRERYSGAVASFPLSARAAVAQEYYARTVAVPTSAIVGMISASHDVALSRKRWDEAIEFAVVARKSVKESLTQQSMLRRTVSSLRFQQRYGRLVVLILATLSIVSGALLFFVLEPDFTRLPTAWSKFISNWGVLSGFGSVLIPLVAWALFAFRERKPESIEPQPEDEPKH